jgi:hypothetical protein
VVQGQGHAMGRFWFFSVCRGVPSAFGVLGIGYYYRDLRALGGVESMIDGAMCTEYVIVVRGRAIKPWL